VKISDKGGAVPVLFLRLRRYGILLLLLLLQVSAPARTLKIASWNVENLFDMQREGTEYEEYLPGLHNWTARILEKKLTRLAEVICDLDADVLALQEVENDRALRRLQKMLGRVGCPYPYRAVTQSPPTAVHVAVLSRRPLRKRRDVFVTRTGRQRSILEVEIADKIPLRLFVNHWRSKRAPESERILYAKALKRRLRKLPAGSEYLLLGDFNSDYQEFRVIEKKHNDSGGVTGINDILATTRQNRMVRGKDLERAAPGEWIHENLWMELPASRRWSHNFFGDKEAIDAILIPPSLRDGRRWEYRPGSFGVFRPDYLFGRHGEIRRWEYRHGRHTGRGYSDHLPVYAVFETVEERAVREKRTDTPDGAGVGAVSLETLLGTSRPDLPVTLRNVAVVFRRGAHAVIQEDPRGPALLIYGAAAGMKEGCRYDLEVHGFKRYHGMPEITDLEILSRGDTIDPSDYIPVFRPGMMRDGSMRYRVVKDFRGVYRNGRIEIGGERIRLYFRKKKWRPSSPTELMIKRAQIGYYKGHEELVIWGRSDFRETGK